MPPIRVKAAHGTGSSSGLFAPDRLSQLFSVPSHSHQRVCRWVRRNPYSYRATTAKWHKASGVPAAVGLGWPCIEATGEREVTVLKRWWRACPLSSAPFLLPLGSPISCLRPPAFHFPGKATSWGPSRVVPVRITPNASHGQKPWLVLLVSPGAAPLVSLSSVVLL